MEMHNHPLLLEKTRFSVFMQMNKVEATKSNAFSQIEMGPKFLDGSAGPEFGDWAKRKMAKGHAFPRSAPSRRAHRGNRHVLASSSLNSRDLQHDPLSSSARIDHGPFGHPSNAQKMQNLRHVALDPSPAGGSPAQRRSGRGEPSSETPPPCPLTSFKDGEDTIMNLLTVTRENRHATNPVEHYNLNVR